jgi:hypothetical protein
MSNGHHDRRWYESLRPRAGRSDWMPGLFYPLIVAALVGLVTVLIGVREDVAVLKERIRHLEIKTGVALDDHNEASMGATAWREGP